MQKAFAIRTEHLEQAIEEISLRDRGIARASQGNMTHAAARVGMQRSNFSSLMKKHGLFIKDIMPQRQ